jgi:hypothetical protein
MLKQAQTMSSVPRTFGVDVNRVLSGGSEQVGAKDFGIAKGMHIASRRLRQW